MQSLPICFFVPIEDSNPQTIWQKFARKSDWLLGTGRKVYQVKEHNNLTLCVQDAQPNTRKDKCIKFLLLVTGVSVIVALIIKAIDRAFGKYNLTLELLQVKFSIDLELEVAELERIGTADLKMSKPEKQALLNLDSAKKILALRERVDGLKSYLETLFRLKASIDLENSEDLIRAETPNFVSAKDPHFGKHIMVQSFLGKITSFYVKDGARLKHLNEAYQCMEGMSRLRWTYERKQYQSEDSLELIPVDSVMHVVST